MFRYILYRVIGIIPSLIVLIFFVVLMVRMLPGNAVDIMLEQQRSATPASRAQLEHRLGLDKSVPAAFVSYTWGVLHGSLGKSVWSQTSVNGYIAKRLPVTVFVSIVSVITSVTIGLSIGVLAAVKQGTVIDAVARGVVILGISVPNFAVATLVVVLPVIFWQWSPLGVFGGVGALGVPAYLKQFVLPGIILGLVPASILMRLARTQMLEVMRQDYVRTARAKGLSERTVVWRHALRNSLIPVIPMIGVQVAYVLGGTVIIESIFGLPGIGLLLINSIAQRDYPIVQGVTLLVGVFVTLTFLVVDLSYGWLDPRASLVG